MSNLLLEIGTEEIPAGYITPALKSLSSALLQKLTDARIDPNVVFPLDTLRMVGTLDTQGALQRCLTGAPVPLMAR